MKKVLLTAALCMAFSASFAQKKAVSEAQSLARVQPRILKKPDQ